MTFVTDDVTSSWTSLSNDLCHWWRHILSIGNRSNGIGILSDLFTAWALASSTDRACAICLQWKSQFVFPIRFAPSQGSLWRHSSNFLPSYCSVFYEIKKIFHFVFDTWRIVKICFSIFWESFKFSVARETLLILNKDLRNNDILNVQ